MNIWNAYKTQLNNSEMAAIIGHSPNSEHSYIITCEDEATAKFQYDGQRWKSVQITANSSRYHG